MSAPTIVDPFFRNLYAKLIEEIDGRGNALIRGSALIQGSGMGVNTTETAMNYQKAVSYIEALQFVIELGIQLDHERYGTRTTNGDD